MNEQQNFINQASLSAVQSEITAYLSADELQINLSDFALFLSVMKNQIAHELILSILLEEPGKIYLYRTVRRISRTGIKRWNYKNIFKYDQQKRLTGVDQSAAIYERHQSG